MRNSLILLLALMGTGASATNVQANDVLVRLSESMYISTFVGLNKFADIKTDTSYSTTNVPYRETYRQDDGHSFRVALGGNLYDWLRSEIEFGVNTSEQAAIREVINGGLNTNHYNGSGDIKTYTALANLWVDLELLENTLNATPYIGGGIGLAYVDPNIKYPNSPAYGPQKSSLEFAAQLGTGLNWDLNDRMQLGLGYRLNFVDGPSTQQVTTVAGEVTKYDFDNVLSHSFGITFTFKLN